MSLTPGQAMAIMQETFPNHTVVSQKVCRNTRTDYMVEDRTSNLRAVFHFQTDKTSRLKAADKPITFALFDVHQMNDLKAVGPSIRWGAAERPEAPTAESFRAFLQQGGRDAVARLNG